MALCWHVNRCLGLSVMFSDFLFFHSRLSLKWKRYGGEHIGLICSSLRTLENKRRGLIHVPINLTQNFSVGLYQSEQNFCPIMPTSSRHPNFRKCPRCERLAGYTAAQSSTCVMIIYKNNALTRRTGSHFRGSPSLELAVEGLGGAAKGEGKAWDVHELRIFSSS